MLKLIQEQKQELDRNYRIKAMLSMVEKRAELLDKLEELEKLEIEFKYKENPTWSESVDYMQKVKSL